MPDTEKAKDFLTEIGKRFQKSDKTELSSLLHKLTQATYNSQGNIREYIGGLSNVVAKIRALDLKIEDELLIFFVLNSLPPQFSQF